MLLSIIINLARIKPLSKLRTSSGGSKPCALGNHQPFVQLCTPDSHLDVHNNITVHVVLRHTSDESSEAALQSVPAAIEATENNILV